MTRFFDGKQVALALAMLSLPAFTLAAPLSFEGDAVTVLDSTAADWTANGVGSASVAYDSINDRLLMAFETKLGDPVGDCRQGLWGIGLAESTDGVSWTLMGTGGGGPIIEPTEDEGYRACVAAHPTIRFDASTGDAIVYFKAETVHPVGVRWTERYTGVGRAVLSFSGAAGGASSSPGSAPEGRGRPADAGRPDDAGGGDSGRGQLTGVEISDAVVLDVGTEFGHPRVVVGRDGVHYMLLMVEGEAYIATSTDGASFSYENGGLPVVSSVAWTTSSLSYSSLTCGDGAEPVLTAYTGGKTTSPAFSGSWGDLTSDDGVSWTEGEEAVQWSASAEWKHIDVLRYADGLTIYSTDKVAGGDGISRTQIVVRSTVDDPASGLVPEDVYSKSCE